jgi:hypothetical protein
MSGVAAAVTEPAQEKTKADAAPVAESKSAEVKPAEGDKPAVDSPKPTPSTEADKKPEADPKPGDKPADEPKPAAVAPEKYDLKLPDGSLVKPESVAAIEAYAKANKLSADAAQAVLSHQHAEHAALQVRRDGWLEEIKNDKEFGGDAIRMNSEHAKRGLELFDPTGELGNVLIATGLGNFPALHKFFVRLGKASSDDVLDRSSSHVSGSENESPAQVLFGKNKQ